MSDVWQNRQVAGLWESAFGVSYEYVKEQLSRVPDEFVTLSFDRNILDAMVYSFPCQWDIKGKKIKSVYTFGFAARVDVRGKGVALKTLSKHFETLRKHQVGLSFLQAEYPGLVAYYQEKAQYSFTEKISVRNYQYCAPSNSPSINKLTPSQAYEAAFSLLKRRDQCILPDRESFENAGMYTEFIGVSAPDGSMSGVLGLDRKTKDIFILSASDKYSESILAHYYMGIANIQECAIERPDENGSQLRRGCCRVINPSFLNEQPHLLKDFYPSFTLRDQLISDNNCLIGGDMNTSIPRVSINELTRHIVPYLEMPLAYY